MLQKLYKIMANLLLKVSYYGVLLVEIIIFSNTSGILYYANLSSAICRGEMNIKRIKQLK